VFFCFLIRVVFAGECPAGHHQMKVNIAQQLFALVLATVICLAAGLAILPAGRAKPGGQYFLAPPYVQLGYRFKGNNLTVMWLAGSGRTDDLFFEYKTGEASDWTGAPVGKQAVNGHPELNLFFAEMRNLTRDTLASYRIRRGKNEIFQSPVRPLPGPGSPVNFAVTGDVGQGSDGEAKVACQMKKRQPALDIIVGDIVYPTGSVRNYLHNFFPYLNSEGGKTGGAALLQSTPTVVLSGNHDLSRGGGGLDPRDRANFGSVDVRDLDLAPDSLAYFTLWKEPLNGPVAGGTANVSVPRGERQRVDDFLKAAGEAYPRMANFSFDYGNCHILALDGNEYMDWTGEKLRQWVDADLSCAKARWKIVVFHQPGFNSDWAHREEQRMRHLCDIFERDGVDICFAGHSHSYQSSYPLHFKEVAAPEGDREATAGYVYGTFKIDKKFDGDKNCKADGIIYVVTGAGGAHLSGGRLEAEPGQWLPFTRSFSSRRYSFTLCRADANKFSLEQIDEDGNTIDHFAIVK
jgi:acid phosphatase type 7